MTRWNWERPRTTTTRRPETPPSKARPAPRAQAPVQECRSPPKAGGEGGAEGGSPGGQRGRSPQAAPTGHDSAPLEMAPSLTGHTANPRRDERDRSRSRPPQRANPQPAPKTPRERRTGRRRGATGPARPAQGPGAVRPATRPSRTGGQHKKQKAALLAACIVHRRRVLNVPKVRMHMWPVDAACSQPQGGQYHKQARRPSPGPLPLQEAARMGRARQATEQRWGARSAGLFP